VCAAANTWVTRSDTGGRGDSCRPLVTYPAFPALYDATASQVFGTVLRVVRDPSQSEEVAQEVFIELWRQATTPVWAAELGAG
jgi:hypothetical protein